MKEKMKRIEEYTKAMRELLETDSWTYTNTEILEIT